jgi:hypothetical protein
VLYKDFFKPFHSIVFYLGDLFFLYIFYGILAVVKHKIKSTYFVSTEEHPYHIPDSSPWPFMIASNIIEISRYTKKMKKKINFSMMFFILAEEKTWNIISFFPEILLSVSLIFTSLIILIKKYTKVPFKFFVKNITLPMSFMALSLALLTFIAWIENIYEIDELISFKVNGSYLYYSSFTNYFKTWLSSLMFFSLALLKDDYYWVNSNKSAVWKMPLLLWSSLLFMYLLVSSNNLLVTFLLVEGLSICLYFILVSELKGNTFSNTLLYFFAGWDFFYFFWLWFIAYLLDSRLFRL